MVHLNLCLKHKKPYIFTPVFLVLRFIASAARRHTAPASKANFTRKAFANRKFGTAALSVNEFFGVSYSDQ